MKFRIHNERQLIIVFALVLLFIINLFFVFGLLTNISLRGITILSLIVCLSCYLLVYFNKSRTNMSLFVALMLYTMATQFGLVVSVLLGGYEVLSGYKNWTVQFISGQYSPYLIKSLALANIAIISYSIAGLVGSKRAVSVLSKDKIENEKEEVLASKMASVILIFVFLYFVFMIITGRYSLSITYSEYKSADMVGSTLFRYILILYSVGTVYMVSPSKKHRHVFVNIVWALIAFMLFATGNKGEVLYPLFSAIGIIGIRDGKLKKKYIIVCLVILFVLIPTITIVRSTGVLSSISEAKSDLFSSFTEMGMQIRTSVYTLYKLDNGALEYLFGQSYYQPVLNIIDSLFFFVDIFPDTVVRNLISDFALGAGYSQVIESYVNFGVMGTIAYFSICGFIVSNEENRKAGCLRLCYIGSMVSILINATRNYFAFVIGQIIIVTMVYYVSKALCKEKRVEQ